MSWALFRNENFEVLRGAAKAYASSENARRHFCAECGASLFYTNETIFPNMTDICSATLDDPGALPLQIHVQTAERISWMKDIHSLPQFERYPGAGQTAAVAALAELPRDIDLRKCNAPS